MDYVLYIIVTRLLILYNNSLHIIQYSINIEAINNLSFIAITIRINIVLHFLATSLKRHIS